MLARSSKEKQPRSAVISAAAERRQAARSLSSSKYWHADGRALMVLGVCRDTEILVSCVALLNTLPHVV